MTERLEIFKKTGIDRIDTAGLYAPMDIGAS